MINSIKYFYNLNVEDIKQIDNDFYFENYILKYYYKNIDINLYNNLINNKIYLHQIIYNRQNEYITYIDNKPYILLKIFKNDKISISFISKYNILFNSYIKPNWANLWTIKVDYYEKNANNIKDKIIKESFNYFIGMVEEAIILYKSLNISSNLYVCHLRFKNDKEFYDPFNIVIDYKMRDYAEYIKNEFYNYNKYYYSYIDKIIINYSYNDVMLFFIRMLYPSNFFDEYDNYIKKEKINYNFFYKKYEYEQYLKAIYKKIRQKYNIVNISWLNA